MGLACPGNSEYPGSFRRRSGPWRSAPHACTRCETRTLDMSERPSPHKPPAWPGRIPVASRTLPAGQPGARKKPGTPWRPGSFPRRLPRLFPQRPTAVAARPAGQAAQAASRMRAIARRLRVLTGNDMRDHGIAGSAAGLVPSGHLCWAYHDRAEFHARVAEYAADGIAAGQYVEYAGEGSASELRDQFAALAGDGPLRDALDAGLIGIRPVGGFHRPPGDSGVLEPAVVFFLADCTEKALAGGYTGFRAVVDATVMARTPGQRDARARLEYLIDQQ